MRRISLILAGIAACGVLAFGGTAAATPAKTCVTHSQNVIGKKVSAKLTFRYVTSSQREFATCGYAKKVMNKILSLRIEKPRRTQAFYCEPTVLRTTPDVVRYQCTFKGADSPMFVKLVFKAKYNLD